MYFSPKSLLARRNAIYQSQFIQQQKCVRQHDRLTDIDVVYPDDVGGTLTKYTTADLLLVHPPKAF